MKNLFYKISVMALSIMASLPFANRVTVKAAQDDMKELTQTSDHFMGVFNNYNGSMNDVPQNTSNNFIIENVDKSSEISLKVSTGRFVKNSENDAYLDLGRYFEGSFDTTAISIKYSDDEDFKKLYEDVKTDITNDLLTAVITTSYVNNIQDISLFWKKLGSDWGASAIWLVYQLEGENNPWKVLGRDDGEGGVPYKNYKLTNEFGTHDDTWSHSGAFAGQYDGTSLPSSNGPFAKELKGKNAKIGFVMSARGGYGNTVQITAFMINRTKSIMNFVNNVEQNSIDLEASIGYDRVVELGGLKFLQSYADALNVDYMLGEDTKNYYSTFNEYYQKLKGENLPFEPKLVIVEEVITLNRFVYDGQPHTPSFKFVNVETNKEVETNWTLMHYSTGSKNAPTEPDWYTVTYQINSKSFKVKLGNDNFLEGTISHWISFRIYDTDETFINSWNALKEEGQERGLCVFLEEGKSEKLQSLINRYDKLDNEYKIVVDSTSDGETDISTSINYFRNMLELKSSNVETSNAPLSSSLLVNNNIEYLLLALIAISLLVISTYVYIYKKRVSNN